MFIESLARLNFYLKVSKQFCIYTHIHEFTDEISYVVCNLLFEMKNHHRYYNLQSLLMFCVHQDSTKRFIKFN